MKFPAAAVFIVFLIVSEADATIEDYHYRGLTTVPQDIPSSVTELKLYQNSISSIKQEDFNDKYPHLIKLSLSSNVISSIENGGFRETELSYLFLGTNRIPTVPDLSRVETTLTRLWLDNNLIHSMQASDFNYLQELTDLDISGNPIAVLPDLSEMNLNTIDVENLAIECCSANWLREDASLSTVYADETTCLSPSQVEGSLLSSISDDQLQTACAAISHIESKGHTIPTPSLVDHDNSSCIFASSSSLNDIWLNVNFTHSWMRVQLDIVFMSDFAVNCNADMMVSYLYSGYGWCSGLYRFCQHVYDAQNVCRFECTCCIDSCNMVNVMVPVGATQFFLCEIIPLIDG